LEKIVLFKKMFYRIVALAIAVCYIRKNLTTPLLRRVTCKNHIGDMKSERLKKLESELEDLEQWMCLGLVPKKDVEKHKEEIGALKIRIGEERERLRYLKESGEVEEYAAPKRSAARQAYAEPHTLPDMEVNDNMTDAGLDMETESYETETASEDETDSGSSSKDEDTVLEDEEEDPFSDRNRWKRGILEDPDRDNW
jgi:hypothetical protein